MKFYFPKDQFDNYDEFTKFDVDNDVRATIMLHPDLKMLWNGFKTRLRGREVELYNKSGGGHKTYECVRLNTSGLVDKVLTTHVIFEYANEVREMFEEFNDLCKNGQFVGKGVFLDEEIGRCKLGFKTRYVKIVMNASAYGILSMGKEYFDVVGTSLMFNYLFSKWVADYGDKFKWLEGKDWIISGCKYNCDNIFKPMINERIDIMKNVMDLCKSGVGDPLEVAIYKYFEKYNVLDVERPTIDVYNVILKSGSDINEFKKVVYELYNRGVLEAEGVECTFIEGKVSIPRKYILKEKK